jgi:hypothetical protein
MQRTHWSAIVALAALALLLLPSAVGARTPTLTRAFFADTEEGQLPDSAFARSSIKSFSDGATQVQVELFNLIPRQRWTVQIYDRGTCAAPRTFIAQFGALPVNGGGTIVRTWTLTTAQRTVLRNALAAHRSLVIRVTHGSLRTCERYDEVEATFFEPRVPEPSFEPTAPPVTPNPFASNALSRP